jgi:hypothetical protein
MRYHVVSAMFFSVCCMNNQLYASDIASQDNESSHSPVQRQITAVWTRSEVNVAPEVNVQQHPDNVPSLHVPNDDEKQLSKKNSPINGGQEAWETAKKEKQENAVLNLAYDDNNDDQQQEIKQEDKRDMHPAPQVKTMNNTSASPEIKYSASKNSKTSHSPEKLKNSPKETTCCDWFCL